MTQSTTAVAPPSQYLDIHGIRTHLREKGEGPPLLLLHGAGGAGPWSAYHDGLAQRFRLLLPDHPGFGLSQRPSWLESVDDMVYHYLDFLEALNLPKVHLMGHSLGGWIAAAIAAAHPEVVDRLVLVDPAGLKKPGLMLPDLFSLTEDESARLVVHDQRLADAALDKETTSEELLQRITNQTTFARLAWNPYLFDPRLGRRLYRARVPALLIWAKQDRVIPLENAEMWMSALPQARLQIIDECGHSVHRERPDDLLRYASEFLSEPAPTELSRVERN